MNRDPRSTTIPCRGDRRSVAKLKTLATARGETMAELVRVALDEVYGDALLTAEAFIVANSGVSKLQNSSKNSIKR